MSEPRVPYATAARELLRTTILDAVDEVVRDEGWAATSMSRVAEIAGVSRQTVYKEFGSRTALADAYIGHRLEQLLAAAVAILTESADLDPALREMVGMFFELISEPVVQTVIKGRELDFEVVPLVRSFYAQASSQIVRLTRQVRPDIDEAVAYGYADSLARLAVSHVIIPIERDEAVDRIVRLAKLLVANA